MNENETLVQSDENIAIEENNNEISEIKQIDVAEPDGINNDEARAEYNLLKTKYKDLFTEDTQKIINRRIKKYKTLLMRFEEARRAEEQNGLMNDSGFEDYLSTGENEIKESFPTFSLEDARKKESFLNLARISAEGGKISLTDAYKLSHFEEILENERKTARENAQKELLSRIESRQARPSENGFMARHQNARFDSAKLSRNERAELAKRAAKGEKIHF